MVDELKPVAKSWLIDRVRLGERHLRYNLEDIVNEEMFNNLQHVKTVLDKKVKNSDESPYDNLSISEDEPHEVDKLI